MIAVGGGTKNGCTSIEVFIVIKDGTHRYYLLKVVRHSFDVYCIPPHLGVHCSLHESGESHFRFEGKAEKPGEEPPVVLLMGEAGTPIDNGVVCATISDLGCASSICAAIFSIVSLSQNFREFSRSAKECFVIDAELFPKGTEEIEIGVWAVPARNKVSFEFNNPNIPTYLLYKVACCEPQIWVYAQPI